MTFDSFIGDWVVSYVFAVIMIVAVRGFLWVITPPK